MTWRVENSNPSMTMDSIATEGNLTTPRLGISIPKDVINEFITYNFTLKLDKIKEKLGTNSSVWLRIKTSVQGSVYFMNYSSPRYEFIDNQDYLTWDSAESFCKSSGGHLASITSPQEQQEVGNLCSKTCWLGG